MQLPMIYLHIPKTAGTSFRKSAEHYFGPDQVLNDYGEKSPVTSAGIKSAFYGSKNVDRLRETGAKHNFLTGHFALRRYREVFPNSPVVTFFRNPVDRVISEYVHFRTHYGFDGSLKEFYNKPQFQNRQSTVMSGASPDQLDFFGLTEDYATSLEIFNARFGTRFPLATLNVGQYKNKKVQTATDEELTEIRELNQQDQQLYDAAVELFHSQSRELVHSFANPNRFAGSVGKLSPGEVIGWLVDRLSDEPAEAVISVNGDERARVVADRFREDVQSRGFHLDGTCGFSFTLDQLGVVAPGDQVTVKTADDSYELANSPRVVG